VFVRFSIAAATAALKRRKALEASRDQMSGMRLTLETQLDALESGLFNAATMSALSNSQKALKQIQKDLDIDKVETIMEDIRRQVEDVEYVQQALTMPLSDALHDDVRSFLTLFISD
jgi:charged multivesicular body protein 4A/B